MRKPDNETHIPSSTLSDYARRFLEHGMDGLRDRRTLPTPATDHPFPAEVAAHILYLKQVYPPMAYREIVRILERKFGYHTNHQVLLDRHDKNVCPLVTATVGLPLCGAFTHMV